MNRSPTSLRDILDILDTEAPFSLAEPWDNVGLMIGDPVQDISSLLLGLDPTEGLLEEACNKKIDLILTHHPVLFNPIKSIRTDQPLGRFIKKALKNNIAVVGCHTNLDVIAQGVSRVFAEIIGLRDVDPLVPTKAEDQEVGFGSIGTLTESENQGVFLARLCDLLQVSAVKLCGIVPEKISRVAVCGGSGSDFAQKALDQGADIYITGEVKHSTARWAEESNFCIIDAGHFATENLIVESFAQRLRQIFSDRHLSVSVAISEFQKNPFTYYFKP